VSDIFIWIIWIMVFVDCVVLCTITIADVIEKLYGRAVFFGIQAAVMLIVTYTIKGFLT
jgi:hypothetical protein